MLDSLKKAFEFFKGMFFNLNGFLGSLISDYGTATYVVLFMIIFVETGVVIMPFLPGDSLLFVTGALIAGGNTGLNIFLMAFLLTIAAFLGDTLNYFIGKKLGDKVFQMNSKYIKKEYLEKTQAFYEKYGGKAIIFARFIPIIRTFAPFVAGIGKMDYKKFITYNIIGGVLWVNGFLALGYIFHELPIVKKHFSLVILAIIVLSVLPAVIEFLRMKFAKTEKNVS